MGLSSFGRPGNFLNEGVVTGSETNVALNVVKQATGGTGAATFQTGTTHVAAPYRRRDLLILLDPGGGGAQILP
ncbi:hypothetical protein M3484_07355 [Pseudomonas sp. GX19020]|uniref:hypothetical protein n=1 Tax=Pseudomonas sp. GX19020 TaxID=2942277 RepID=UPI0020185C06|nr:hypothetical protein [Pseudomonas sp. GX19020]MCL4066383.1 hypothetical protein [Pseudomonas sp. GX19020]